ncbi:MAG: hypothetical protein ACJAVS_001337 [Paracoccaceae bacterium]|jgi:hypothetical protein
MDEPMNLQTLIDAAPLTALGFAVGAGAGAVHFATLWRVTLAYVSNERPGRAALLHVARLVALAATLAGLAWLGAPALLAGLAGVMLARRIVLRRLPVPATAAP